METRTIVEVNGVKLDVDLRTATRVDTLRVGDRVKVLKKEPYGSDRKVYPGVVCGFEPFTTLPTIIIAYLDVNWNEAKLLFAFLNSESKDVEVIKSIDHDLDLDKANVMALMDRDIEKKQAEVDEARRRRDYFLREFGAYWAPVEQPA